MRTARCDSCGRDEPMVDNPEYAGSCWELPYGWVHDRADDTDRCALCAAVDEPPTEPLWEPSIISRTHHALVYGESGPYETEADAAGFAALVTGEPLKLPNGRWTVLQDTDCTGVEDGVPHPPPMGVYWSHWKAWHLAGDMGGTA